MRNEPEEPATEAQIKYMIVLGFSKEEIQDFSTSKRRSSKAIKWTKDQVHKSTPANYIEKDITECDRDRLKAVNFDVWLKF
jgi:ERCC4-related helicase